MKYTLATSFAAGLFGAMLSITAYVQLAQPVQPPPQVDLANVASELRLIREQMAATQNTMRAGLEADEVARQSEKDEVAEAIRLRNRMMGLSP